MSATLAQRAEALDQILAQAHETSPDELVELLFHALSQAVEPGPAPQFAAERTAAVRFWLRKLFGYADRNDDKVADTGIVKVRGLVDEIWLVWSKSPWSGNMMSTVTCRILRREQLRGVRIAGWRFPG